MFLNLNFSFRLNSRQCQKTSQNWHNESLETQLFRNWNSNHSCSTLSIKWIVSNSDITIESIQQTRLRLQNTTVWIFYQRILSSNWPRCQTCISWSWLFSNVFLKFQQQMVPRLWLFLSALSSLYQWLKTSLKIWKGIFKTIKKITHLSQLLIWWEISQIRVDFKKSDQRV